jgi:hypothetical protein
LKIEDNTGSVMVMDFANVSSASMVFPCFSISAFMSEMMASLRLVNMLI